MFLILLTSPVSVPHFFLIIGWLGISSFIVLGSFCYEGRWVKATSSNNLQGRGVSADIGKCVVSETMLSRCWYGTWREYSLPPPLKSENVCYSQAPLMIYPELLGVSPRSVWSISKQTYLNVFDCKEKKKDLGFVLHAWAYDGLWIWTCRCWKGVYGTECRVCSQFPLCFSSIAL